jgi:hypothetical protein
VRLELNRHQPDDVDDVYAIDGKDVASRGVADKALSQ